MKVFELWKRDTRHYLRVLWGGMPLKTSTPLGTLDLIPVGDFLAVNRLTCIQEPFQLIRISSVSQLAASLQPEGRVQRRVRYIDRLDGFRWITERHTEVL